MAINYKKIHTGVTVVPKLTSASDMLGELETLSSTNKIYFHNGTTNSALVTESHAATLTNKSIDANTNPISNLDTTNLEAGVLNTDLSAGPATDLQIPSALAVQDYVDGGVGGDVAALVTLSGVPAGSTDLGTFSGTVIPDNSDNKEALQALETQVDLNTTTVAGKVSGPVSSTDNAIARFDGTTGQIIQDSLITVDDTGIMTAPTVIVDRLQLGTNLLEALTINTGATGTNASVSITSSYVRLQNSSLVSISEITNQISGKNVTIENATGNVITINNNAGITPSQGILTGTKANITLKDEASLTLKYDSIELRWMVIGGTGGTGVAGINYNLNPDAEAGTAGYVTYADAAAPAPVDGIGGTANITFTASNVAPLRGTQSFLVTKDAANRRGQGVSYDFTIDSADQASILRISFDYNTSTNYTDDDMRVYVYDVTNSQLIEVIDRTIAARTQGHYVGSFQSSVNSTSYRLILHVASVNALDYTVKMDNFVIGPQNLSKGQVILTQVSESATSGTFAGGGAVVVLGANLSGYPLVSYSAGVFTALRTITLDASFTLRTPNTTPVIARITVNGSGVSDDSSPGTVSAWASTSWTGRVLAGQTFSFNNQGGTADIARIYFQATYISENLTLSEDLGNRTISMFAKGNANQVITANVTDIPFAALAPSYDTTASWNGSQYTIPETGYYDIAANVDSAGAAIIVLGLYVNGVGFNIIQADEISTLYHDFTALAIPFTKGQVVSLRSNTNITLTNAQGIHRISIAKRSSPQTLAGGEEVAARYTSDSGQAVSNSFATIIYEDRNYDTHNAYNVANGQYTTPMNGKYTVSAKYTTASVPWTAGQNVRIAFYVNGTIVSRFDQVTIAATLNYPCPPATDTITLNKGDILTIRAENSTSASMATAVGLNTFSIVREG